jgi:cyanophycinase
MKLQGQRVDPAASDFKPDSGRLPFYMDILGDSTIVAAMAMLIDSPAPELRGLAVQGLAGAADPQPDLGFEFRLYKGAGSIGWCSSASGAEECTLLNLRLDVLPLQLTRPFYRLMP